jgi:hypothetical protein
LNPATFRKNSAIRNNGGYMALAHIDVRDESGEVRSGPRPAVSREIVTSEIGESPESISNKLISRIGLLLFYGILIGMGGWNIYLMIRAVMK